MSKLGIAERAGGMAMIHRVSALAVGRGRLHDYIATEVGNFALIVGRSQMLVCERLVEAKDLAFDGRDDARLGQALFVIAGFGRSKDDAVADAPARGSVGKRHFFRPLGCRSAELEPG